MASQGSSHMAAPLSDHSALSERDDHLIGRGCNILALARLACGHQEIARMLERRPMADAVEGRYQAFRSAAEGGELAPVTEGKWVGIAFGPSSFGAPVQHQIWKHRLARIVHLAPSGARCKDVA